MIARSILLLLTCISCFSQVGLRNPAFVGQLQRPSAGGGGSAFTPSSYGTVRYWFKARALSLANNDPVVTATDSGPNGYNATNLTGSSSRPTFKTSQINSLPVVRFDGGDFLFWSATTGNARTIMAVVGNVTHTAANAVLGTTTGVQRGITFFPDATTIYAGDGTELFSNTFTNWVNTTKTYTFPASPAFAVVTQINSSAVDLGAFYIGFGPNDPFNGDVAEIVIWDGVITDIPGAQAALMGVYGL